MQADRIIHGAAKYNEMAINFIKFSLSRSHMTVQLPILKGNTAFEYLDDMIDLLFGFFLSQRNTDLFRKL